MYTNMKTHQIVRVIVAGSILGSVASGSAAPQNAVERSRVNAMSRAPVIVASARVTWGPLRFRNISVFVEPKEFTIQNLKAVFLRLSEEYAIEDHLKINAFSNRRRVAEEAERIAAIQPPPLTLSDRPNGFCVGTEPPPLSAEYHRGNLSEYFNYYLFAQGADFRVGSSDGKTPLRIAEALNDQEVISLLKGLLAPGNET
jgi:hypothetical protein